MMVADHICRLADLNKDKTVVVHSTAHAKSIMGSLENHGHQYNMDFHWVDDQPWYDFIIAEDEDITDCITPILDILLESDMDDWE